MLECAVMSNVIDLYGNCQAENCRQEDRAITDQSDVVKVRGKLYHKRCAPTPKELEAEDRSS